MVGRYVLGVDHSMGSGVSGIVLELLWCCGATLNPLIQNFSHECVGHSNPSDGCGNKKSFHALFCMPGEELCSVVIG